MRKIKSPFLIKCKVFIVFTLAEILVLSMFFFYSLHISQSNRENGLEAKKELVGRLGLTDFAIWTEARYTRHPSQADFFSSFQDFPLSFEHFPAGSIIAPVNAAYNGDQ